MSDDEILSALLDGGRAKVQNCLRVRGPNAVIEGKPVLHWVLSVGNDEAVATLLEMGADPNARCAAGDTALALAAYGGNVEIVRRLLKAGADVAAVDANGRSALMCAAKAGHLGVAHVLIESCASPKIVDRRGLSALHWAVTEFDNVRLVEFLIAQGAPTQLRSLDGLTAHDYAVKLNRPLSAARLQ